MLRNSYSSSHTPTVPYLQSRPVVRLHADLCVELLKVFLWGLHVGTPDTAFAFVFGACVRLLLFSRLCLRLRAVRAGTPRVVLFHEICGQAGAKRHQYTCCGHVQACTHGTHGTHHARAHAHAHTRTRTRAACWLADAYLARACMHHLVRVGHHPSLHRHLIPTHHYTRVQTAAPSIAATRHAHTFPRARGGGRVVVC